MGFKFSDQQHHGVDKIILVLGPNGFAGIELR
jgi:hypothetical protein